MAEEDPEKISETSSSQGLRKFTVRIPIAVYELLERYSGSEGSKPATTAALFIIRAISQLRAQGLIPDANGDLPQPVMLTEQFQALDRILLQLADGEEISEADLAEAALITTISVDELNAICVRLKEGNGHPNPVG